MNDFTFHRKTKLIFGRSAMGKIGSELKPIARKILLTYGKGSIKSAGIYDKVMEQLNGFEVKEFSGIEPNPRVATIREAILLGKNFQPDLILAVGGGSVIDGSKLIAAGIKSEHDAWDLVLDESKIGDCVPLATVLTVAATGSEMDPFAVITNWETHEKKSFEHENVLPLISFCDPQNTYSVTADQTAYGIVDIYSHVLEQYMTASTNTELQDRWAEGILLTLLDNAHPLLTDLQNYNARANVMLCSTMALNGLISLGTPQDWATHAIEHELSAYYDIPHGLGLAILTPRWLETVALTQKPDKLVQYGKRIFGLTGSDQEIATLAIMQTFDFFHSMNIKMYLHEVNITDEHFDIMVKNLESEKIGEFPLSADKIRNILDKCL